MSTHEAKPRRSELISETEQGTEAIVARNGRPVAKIVAWMALSSTLVPAYENHAVRRFKARWADRH